MICGDIWGIDNIDNLFQYSLFSLVYQWDYLLVNRE